MNLKPIFLFLSALISVIIISVQFTAAQNNPRLITGNVVDLKTGEPVALAEVFISGTTVGTISDKQGNFTLKVPFFPCTMVVDHVAYESHVTNLERKGDEQKITLRPFIKSIEEVKVTGKSKRKKNLRFFYSHFLNKNRNKIEILNDSVLYFERSEKEFIAYCYEPLIIMNNILGYKIKLRMIKFRVFRKEFPNGPDIKINSGKGTEFMHISGHYFYEPFETNSIEALLMYQNNRRSHYFGSPRHFLKSIYGGTSKQQGFETEIFPKKRNLIGFKRVKNYDAGYGGRNFFIDCDSIKVSYKFGKDRYPYNYSLQKRTSNPLKEVSTIYRSNKIFTILENGNSPNVEFIISGPMFPGNNLANTLPQDYDPFR